MIYFVTDDKNYNQVEPTDSLVIINSSEELKNLATIFTNSEDKIICIDLETNGLDVYKNEILLVIIGNKRHQIVIDMRGDDVVNVTIELLKVFQDWLVLGHNIKFDYKFLNKKHGIEFNKMYDTMIADQRIYQGLGITDVNPTGYSFSLEAVITRRIPQAALSIDKTTRVDFIDANKDTFIYTNKHITYAAKDVEDLVELYRLQRINIGKYNLSYLVDEIEMPLIRCIAQAEIEGFDIDIHAWNKLAREKILERYKVELELDNEIRNLRENIFINLSDTEKLYLRGKFDLKRSEPMRVNYTGLFGEELGNKEIFGIKKSKVNLHPDLMNYGSATQIIDLFARLKQPLPTKSGTYVVPVLDDKGRLTNDYEAFTTDGKILDVYVNEYPNTIVKDLIKGLIKYGKLSTRINTFGESFVTNYINPISGKVHTLYRQCDATNSRFQSGGGKKEPDKYNAQNIPKEKEYRSCFIAPKGHSLSTSDLTGAETIIVCSKAQDKSLKKMAIEEDDIHSPIATAVWKAIYLYRAGLEMQAWVDCTSFLAKRNDEETHKNFQEFYESDLSTGTPFAENYKLYKEFFVTKIHNKDVRTKFKNVTFAAIYGAYYKTTAKTLNVSLEEGKIVLFVVKSMVPRTFSYVEHCAKQGIQQGYLVLNNRTNSRLWLPDVLRAFSSRTQLEYKLKANAEGKCRNITISGTQADMIKEMVVEIDRYIRLHSLGCKFLKQVHDELIYSQPLNMDGHSEEWKTNPHKLTFTNHKGEIVEGSFPEFVNETMQRIANLYLQDVEMKVETNVGSCWIK